MTLVIVRVLMKMDLCMPGRKKGKLKMTTSRSLLYDYLHTLRSWVFTVERSLNTGEVAEETEGLQRATDDLLQGFVQLATECGYELKLDGGTQCFDNLSILVKIDWGRFPEPFRLCNLWQLEDGTGAYRLIEAVDRQQKEKLVEWLKSRQYCTLLTPKAIELADLGCDRCMNRFMLLDALASAIAEAAEKRGDSKIAGNSKPNRRLEVSR